MMKPYWVTFSGRASVCIEAATSDVAKEQAGRITGAVVLTAKSLPYPAEPQIGEYSGVPQFCWRPDTCAGKSACPRNPACSE